jgi:hypothetical protein
MRADSVVCMHFLFGSSSRGYTGMEGCSRAIVWAAPGDIRKHVKRIIGL